MANIKTITAADAIFLLTIPDLFGSPVQLQGFSTDTSFTNDALPATEVVMGVDGHMSVGVVLHPTKMKIDLAPDSDSVDIFDQWNQAQKTGRTVLIAQGHIELPGLGKAYTLNRGALTSTKQFPDVKKTLQSQEFEITWESITNASV
jgi:hypothetical protein